VEQDDHDNEAEDNADETELSMLPFMFTAFQTKTKLAKLGVTLYEPPSSDKQQTLGKSLLAIASIHS
jgi:hypothetical protein